MSAVRYESSLPVPQTAIRANTKSLGLTTVLTRDGWRGLGRWSDSKRGIDGGWNRLSHRKRQSATSFFVNVLDVNDDWLLA